MSATTITPPSSSVPSTVVSHGPRSGLRQKPGRNGRERRRLHAAALRRRAKRRPPPAKRPATRSPAAPRDRGDRVGVDARPVEPRPHGARALEPHADDGRSAARRVDLDDRLAARAQQLGGAREQALRVAADPDVAVEQQHGRPAPRRAPAARRRSRAARGRRGAARGATATGEMSIPVAARPWASSAASMRPGPQPTSSTGARGVLEHEQVGRRRRARASAAAGAHGQARGGAHAPVVLAARGVLEQPPVDLDRRHRRPAHRNDATRRDRTYGLTPRQREAHARAARRVGQPDPPAVRLDDRAGDREAEPGARARARGLAAAAVERLEHARAVVRPRSRRRCRPPRSRRARSPPRRAPSPSRRPACGGSRSGSG